MLGNCCHCAMDLFIFSQAFEMLRKWYPRRGWRLQIDPKIDQLTDLLCLWGTNGIFSLLGPQQAATATIHKLVETRKLSEAAMLGQ
jgi:hypothetical protein